MRRWLFLIALACALFPARAEEKPVTDVAAVRQHYEEVVARPEFHETPEPADAFPWRNWITQWLTHLISQFQNYQYSGKMSGLAGLLVTTLSILAIVGVGYVLVRLSRRRRDPLNGPSLFKAGGKTVPSPQLDEERLRRAIARGDWHTAWLATWLQFLARLEQRRIVEADRSRTNREYLTQLRQQTLPESALPLLAGLVEDYDRVIYGRREIDEPVWRAFRRRIDEVALMLHLHTTAPVLSTPESPT